MDNLSDYHVVFHQGSEMDDYCVVDEWKSATRSGKCSLRIAFYFCLLRVPWSVNVVSSCRIHLPFNSTIILSYGDLLAPIDSYFVGDYLEKNRLLSVQRSIEIVGTKSQIKPLDSSTRFLVSSTCLSEPQPFANLLCNSSIFISGIRFEGFKNELNSSVLELSYFSTIILRDVIFSNNLGVSGGALYIGNSEDVSIEKIFCDKNSAVNGGCIFLNNTITAKLSDINCVQNNVSNIGGCIVIESSSRLEFSKITCIENFALNYGGCISANNLSNFLAVDSSYFRKNTATYGSSIVMKACESVLIKNSVFVENLATIAGTIFWMSFSMIQSPQDANNQFIANQATYGTSWATEAIRLTSNPPVITVENYNSGHFLSPILISISDHYGQYVSSYNSSTVWAYVSSESIYHYTCEMNTPSIFGTTVESILAGQTVFNRLGARCIPGGYFNITFFSKISVYVLGFPDYFDNVHSIRASKPVERALSLNVLTNFRPCRVGEKFDYFSASKSTCSVCTDGYSLKNNDDRHVISCTPCPNGALYCYGSQIFLPSGSWRYSKSSTVIFPCPLLGACIGSNFTGESSCVPPSFGPLCGSCKSGFFMDTVSNVCQSCYFFTHITSKGLIIVSFVGFGVLAFIIFILVRGISTFREFVGEQWSDSNEKKEDFDPAENSIVVEEGVEVHEAHNHANNNHGWSSRVKIFFATYQILFQGSSPSGFQFPSTYSKLSNYLSILNFNISGVLPLRCFFEYTYLTMMFSVTSVPLVIFAAFLSILLVFYVMIFVFQYFFKNIDLYPALLTMSYRSIRGLIVLAYIILPSLTSIIFNTFKCIDVDPLHQSSSVVESFLVSDLTINCTDAIYYNFRWWAVVMVIIYPVGITASFWFLLNQCRIEIVNRVDITRIHHSKGVKVRSESQDRKDKPPTLDRLVKHIGFLYQSYKPEFWYWEIIEVFRRLMLTSLLTVFISNIAVQATCFVGVSIIFVKIYQWYKPFQSHAENVLGEIGQYQILVTYLITGIIYQNSLPLKYSTEFMDAVLVCVSLLAMVINMYFLVLENASEEKKDIKGLNLLLEDVIHSDIKFSRSFDIAMMPIVLKNMSESSLIVMQFIIVNSLLRRRRVRSATHDVFYVDRSLPSLSFGRDIFMNGEPLVDSHFMDSYFCNQEVNNWPWIVNYVPVTSAMESKILFCFADHTCSSQNEVPSISYVNPLWLVDSQLHTPEYVAYVNDLGDEFFSISSSEQSYFSSPSTDSCR